MSAAELPREPSEVTPQWLEAALGERFPGTRIARVEVVEVRHGTNSNARLRVSYAEPCDLPETYFLKLPPLDPERREQINATGMGRREALFYLHLAERVAMRVPRPYVARLDEATNEFVLLIEDLEAGACTFPDVERGVSFSQAERAMTDFAQLHVRFEDESLRQREAGWVERMPRGTRFGPDMLQYGLDHHRARIRDAYAELAALYIARQAELEALWDEGIVTVLQGDSHIGNLFLDGDRASFLDWGLIQLGNPMRDVGYFITMALSPENRREHERALIARYLDARRELGGREIPFEEAWRLHLVHAVYAVPAACPLVLFPENEPEENARLAAAFLERSMSVVEDLDLRNFLRKEVGL